MSNLLLNLDELNARHDRSEDNRIKLFDDILKLCHNKIRKYNKEFKKYECLYTPPVFVMGHPPYNRIELIDYLIASLKKNGLKAEWIPIKDSIYVSWRKTDVDMNQYHTHFSKATYSDDLSRHFAVLRVPPTLEQKPTKKGKKNAKPTIQHVALLEYQSGAQDMIPISLK
jgi:hypothetical protein